MRLVPHGEQHRHRFVDDGRVGRRRAEHAQVEGGVRRGCDSSCGSRPDQSAGRPTLDGVLAGHPVQSRPTQRTQAYGTATAPIATPP